MGLKFWVGWSIVAFGHFFKKFNIDFKNVNKSVYISNQYEFQKLQNIFFGHWPKIGHLAHCWSTNNDDTFSAK
jgi:hypothetical protein